VPTKIGGVDTPGPASVTSGRAVQRPQDATSAGTQGSAEGASQDVQITGTARQLAALEQAIRELPAVNETRVAQIRTALEQGTYTIRPEHIADHLMQLEKALSPLSDSDQADSSGASGQSGQ